MRFLFLSVALVLSLACQAQKTDSIKHDNGFLYYHEYGLTRQPAVILLTGGPGNSYDQLEAFAKTLSLRFRCILPEQRGTGRSIPRPFDSSTINLASITNDIKTLMDHLHLERAIIVGHSWGGMLAMNFAAQHPERIQQLILIAPGPHKNVREGFEILFTNRRHTRSFEEEKRMEQLSALIEKDVASPEEVAEYQKLQRRAYIFANPLPDTIFQKINARNNRKMASLLMVDLYKNYNVSNTLNNYKGSIDVITGRQDVVGFFSYELKQDIPRATIYWINECGHFPMYEQPGEFYRLLYTILQ